MPPTQFDISWENLRDFKLRIPSIEEQRKIVDHLDVEIATIDSLTAYKRNQIGLIKSFPVTVFLQELEECAENDSSILLPWLSFRVRNKQLFGRMFDISLGKLLS